MKSLLALVLPLTFLFLALAPGAQAPSFEAKNQDGKIVRLSDFKGKFLLIYFYPKDDTPGCTKEACSFRDEFSAFSKVNAVVLGVSRQDGKSHQEFRAKHHLQFDLLADQDGSLTEAFGVEKMPVIGWSKRESVLIGPDGRVLQFYRSVDPATHAAQVMADIKKATR